MRILEIVYKGRDNSNDLILKADGIAVDLSSVTKIELVGEPTKDKINSSEDVFNYFLKVWENENLYESFYVLFLNRANIIIGYRRFSFGGISGTVIDRRLIFAAALKCCATSIIVAHNHPSGNLNPSDADKAITKKLFEAGKIMDIQLYDHLIITKDSYFSFADNSLIW